MSLSRILDELAETMSFEGCHDPLHNLRGVCAKGVKEGWLTRVARGVFQLKAASQSRRATTSPRSNVKPSAKLSAKPSAKPQIVLKRAAVGDPPPRTSSGARALQISIGDVTLTAPPGMNAEALAQIVSAIREAASN